MLKCMLGVLGYAHIGTQVDVRASGVSTCVGVTLGWDVNISMCVWILGCTLRCHLGVCKYVGVAVWFWGVPICGLTPVSKGCVLKYIMVCVVCAVWPCVLGCGYPREFACVGMGAGLCVVWVRMCMVGSGMGPAVMLLPTIMRGWLASPEHCDPSVSFQGRDAGF